MGNLSDKTILITGASSGIGEYTAYEAAQRGAHLILCARRTDRLQEVQTRCERLGASSVLFGRLDIADADSIDDLVAALLEDQIIVDVLINNAGIGHSEPFFEMAFDDITNLFQVNVFGLMYLTQQLAIPMLDNFGGQIINIASLAGKVSTPNYSIYGATKGALISFSNALRLELKPFNIQVTTVNYGPVDTPFFDHIDNVRKEKSVNSPFSLKVTDAAKVVANTIGKNKREINRPHILGFGAKVYQLFPSLGDYLLTQFFKE